MSIYRVFLTRHFIAVKYFDLEAETSSKAKRKAISIANKRYGSAAMRRIATDNGWGADDPVKIPTPGHWAKGVHRVREVAPGVWEII